VSATAPLFIPRRRDKERSAALARARKQVRAIGAELLVAQTHDVTRPCYERPLSDQDRRAYAKRCRFHMKKLEGELRRFER
jgi:hypothetical protein